jgi:hypothetical protein
LPDVYVFSNGIESGQKQDHRLFGTGVSELENAKPAAGSDVCPAAKQEWQSKVAPAGNDSAVAGASVLLILTERQELYVQQWHRTPKDCETHAY